MTRCYIIVEGDTEESFVNGPLMDLLSQSGVLAIPTKLGVPGHKGGRTNYARVRKDVVLQLKQDRNAYCSTMLDFYALGGGFPGTPPKAGSNRGKVEEIELAVKQDICGLIPELRADIRLIPYLSLHEYEGLLFSDPYALAQACGRPQLFPNLNAIRNAFPTPEDINDDPSTAPSKRLTALVPGYRKVIQGTLAAKAIGIEKILQECPHFRAWFERLQSLPPL